jgi:hypothetical protein
MRQPRRTRVRSARRESKSTFFTNLTFVFNVFRASTRTAGGRSPSTPRWPCAEGAGGYLPKLFWKAQFFSKYPIARGAAF